MRRPLAPLLLVLLLAGAAAAVAADEGKDESGHGGDEREGDGDGGDRRGDDDGHDDRDRDDNGDDGKDDDKDEDKDEDDDRREGRKEKKGKEGKAPRRQAAPAPAPSPPPAPQPVPVALTGDAALRQSVRNEPGRLTYVFLVGGLGPSKAHDVSLAADLPDLATTWTLSGAGSEGCAVDRSLRLTCSWGDLGLGDVKVFQATAPVEKAPAWQVRTVAELAAGNDRDPRNDAAATTVGILLT